MNRTFLDIHRTMVAQAAREGAELGARQAAMRATLSGGMPTMASGGFYSEAGYQSWWRAGDIVGSHPVGP